MSEFVVKIRRIEEKKIHENADRLELCKCSGLGYWSVCQKDVFNLGDLVVYFPEDAVLPEVILEKIGLTGKLSGKNKNRVKAVTLRGVVSQGIVSPASLILGDLNVLIIEGIEVTELLGIEKYEAPEIFTQSGNLISLPSGAKKYDLENVNSNLDVFDILLTKKVTITEKVEGTNLSVTWNNEGIFVNQRNHSIVELEGHSNSYWQAARSVGILDKIKDFAEESGHGSVSFYGEMVGNGIQGNIYDIPKPTVLFYDIFVDEQYFIEDEVKNSVFNALGLKRVPVLAENVLLSDWLGGRDVVTASNGFSMLKDGVLREGIVITPVKEEQCSIGRLVLKQRDPIYLSKSSL